MKQDNQEINLIKQTHITMHMTEGQPVTASLRYAI